MTTTHNLTRSLLLNTLFITALAATTEFIVAQDASARSPIAILRINFPADDRPATFVVPDRDTSVSSEGGNLTRHEIHLAKLIELTHGHWCKTRTSESGIYVDYSANNGKEFRGRFYIGCQFAQETMNRFGTTTTEFTEFTDINRRRSLNLPTLALTPANAPDFKSLVQSIKPACVGTLCPGDRISD